MNWINLCRRFSFFIGAKEACKLVWQLKTKKGKNMRTALLRHPFSIRFTPADLSVLQNVLVECEYKVPVTQDARTILDAGANIGMASLYLANVYPHAEMVAIEAGADNFEVLQSNLRPYTNIKPILGALWGKDTNLEFIDTGRGPMLYQVRESHQPTNNSVKAYTIQGIMQQMGWQTLDVLKLDIEGAEKSIFENNADEWLPKTKVIMIELHDRYTKDSAKTLWRALDKYNFSFDFRKETALLVNEDLLTRFKTYH